jgi:hypothetical protein
MKKFLLIFTFIYSIANAQDFKLGFDMGIHQVRIKSGTGILGGNGLPLSIDLNARYDLFQNFTADAKIGRTFHTQFLGWEFGLSGTYNFYAPFYFTGGMLLHLNEGSGIANGEWTAYTNILMLYPGLGVNFSSVFSIELNYFIPTSEKIIGGAINFYNDNPEKNYTRFKSMIRLDFVFGWDL